MTQRKLGHEYCEARLKELWDSYSFLHEAKEGFKEGLVLGELMGEIHVCQIYLKLPVTPRDELEHLYPEELVWLHDELVQRVFPPPPESDQPIVVNAAAHSSTRTHLP